MHEFGITCKSCQSKSINILGLMNRKNELFYEIVKPNINSEVVIIAVFINIEYRDLGFKEEGRSFVLYLCENRYNSWDKFSRNFSNKTVVIMDKASIHTMYSILNKL